MGESKSALSFLNPIYKSTFQKKYLVMTLFVLVLFILFSGGFGAVAFMVDRLSEFQGEEGSCGDGTPYNTCSSVKPYLCFQGKFIDLASICGCPEGFSINNENCIYYPSPSKVIFLKYMLHGGTYSIDFPVYDEFEEYISNVPRSINSSGESSVSRADFKLKAINEEEQRKFLLPLVIKIQNITENKEDQALIAISLVQNIPFGNSNKTFFFWGEEVNHTRYPYEVIYDFEGVCGEKTDLLSFLLRELGYGVSFFYYQEENHEAVGIKCPMKQSLIDTGYCFVETTGPSLISDSSISYVGIGRLYSTPEFYILSDGNSLGKNLEDYEDVKTLNRIRDDIQKSGLIGPIDKKTLDRIKQKYGLADQYYG